MRITVDFETQSRCDLKAAGTFEYSKDKSTRALCFALKMPGVKTGILKYDQIMRPYREQSENFRRHWEIWAEAPSFFFVAHNAFFEQCIYNNILVEKLGWPEIPIEKWLCTMAKAAACAIPNNLGDAGAVMRLKAQKDYEGYQVMMKLCKPTRAWKNWHEHQAKTLARGDTKTAKENEKFKPEFEFWCPKTAPDDFEKLYYYCERDAETEERLDQALPDLTPTEQELWWADQRINMRGVNTDTSTIKEIYSIMQTENKRMGKELDTLTMGLVSSGHARGSMLEFLELEGLELPDLKAKTVEDFLKNGELTGDARKLLELRKALTKSSTAKYAKFLEQTRFDGRVRGMLIYHRASTGRWGGSGVQPQNFPRGIIDDIYQAIYRIKNHDVEDLKLLYGENLMPLFSSVLRGMFIASPGHQLFVEDLNAIECRVLWWLAGHNSGLDMFRQNQDPYRAMAAIIFRKAYEDVTKEERQVGKAAVLGCGYQMGAKKFMTAAWDVYRAKTDLSTAQVAVSAYREIHWPVRELWNDYQTAAINAVENDGKTFTAGKCEFVCRDANGSAVNRFLWVKLPSGRYLAYNNPSVEMGPVRIPGEGPIIGYEEVDGRELEIREDDKVFEAKKLRYWATNFKAKKSETTIPKWAREATYGGKLAENITQAVSRDVLANALLRAEKSGFKVLMHSHDELVSEAPIGNNLVVEHGGEPFSPLYRKIMEEPPSWAPDLPLKSEGWVNTRYRKG